MTSKRRKKHKPEQIVAKLRDADAMLRRPKRPGREGLDAMSRHLRRRGTRCHIVARFRGWESPDDSGPIQRANACGLHPQTCGRIRSWRGSGPNR